MSRPIYVVRFRCEHNDRPFTSYRKARACAVAHLRHYAAEGSLVTVFSVRGHVWHCEAAWRARSYGAMPRRVGGEA